MKLKHRPRFTLTIVPSMEGSKHARQCAPLARYLAFKPSPKPKPTPSKALPGMFALRDLWPYCVTRVAEARTRSPPTDVMLQAPCTSAGEGAGGMGRVLDQLLLPPGAGRAGESVRFERERVAGDALGVVGWAFTAASFKPLYLLLHHLSLRASFTLFITGFHVHAYFCYRAWLPERTGHVLHSPQSVN